MVPRPRSSLHPIVSFCCHSVFTLRVRGVSVLILGGTASWGTYVTYIIGVKIQRKAGGKARDAKDSSSNGQQGGHADSPYIESVDEKHAFDYSAPPSTVGSRTNLALDMNMLPTSPYSSSLPSSSSISKGSKSFAAWSPHTPASPYPSRRPGIQSPISPSLDMSVATLWLTQDPTPSSSEVALVQAQPSRPQASSAAASRQSLPLSPVQEKAEPNAK